MSVPLHALRPLASLPFAAALLSCNVRAPEPAAEPRPAPAASASAPSAAPVTTARARNNPVGDPPVADIERGAEAVRDITRIDADVDGDGRLEIVRLTSDGTVWVDGTSLASGLTSDNAGQWPLETELRVVDVDTKDPTKEILLVHPAPQSEDPPLRHQLYFYRAGALILAFDRVVGPYGAVKLTFPGDGTLRYLESQWMACERGRYAGNVAIQEVIHRPDGKGTFAESKRKNAGRPFDCGNLAACPYVYVVDGDRARFTGEILRNVRGAAASTRQSLGLPAAKRGPLTIRLAEEKEEVTFLDQIAIEIEGRTILPNACQGASPPAYCVADGEPWIMREGDAIDLVFDVPAAKSPQLWARGYYIPTPTAKTRRAHPR